MELRLPHMLHLFNVFHENDGKENCAKVLEEEVNKMFGIKSLYDEHDCNVVSMNSLNIHDANDMQSSHLLAQSEISCFSEWIGQVGSGV
jgi:hypothetical protein